MFTKSANPPSMIFIKRLTAVLPLLIFSFLSWSQFKIKNKLYPSLLWEISGNGLKKPSYLFGTMHVSSKLAFHLSDSFYLGIRQAEVVALETNPESWQADMSLYDVNEYGFDPGGMNAEAPNDFLTIRSLKFEKYEKLLEAALFSEPSVINNLLYRSYSNSSSDFEEDTYLDMYIYQVGKKLGKKVAGVEDYGESMKLMMEAYRDAAKDRNRKQKSYEDIDVSPLKLQEAYRTGNLDLLDSINRLNSYSDAFDEKFLFRRNEIQADNIDSILKRSTLFVGVGAAHLPGSRGVIEILRRKGYKMRPIMMGHRDRSHKDLVEKIRVPVVFTSYTAPDGVYKVNIPGRLYDFSEYGGLDQRQYADMANGSYYMVTRIQTNGLFWGHTMELISHKIDSVLYENVPGKILTKKPIIRNGYKGFDITNRTRRGDFQRYNIFITPFEVLFFKMGGNSNYVRDGDEAKRFFESIQLKELKMTGWRKYQPFYGGFSVDIPHEPYVKFDGNIQYDAEDKLSGNHFTILRTDIHNHHFVEEDGFDLSLMEESYSASEFIREQFTKSQINFRGYPALDAKYMHKDGSISMARFIIQGSHYYTLIAHGNKEEPQMRHFLNSFEIKPLVYQATKKWSDSSMYFSVNTSWKPVEKKTEIDMTSEEEMPGMEEDNISNTRIDYRSRLIVNDTTGESIFISFYKIPEYYYSKDSSKLEKFTNRLYDEADSTWKVRSRKKYTLPGNVRVWDVCLSDTNSSRLIRVKMFYKDGVIHLLSTQSDTLSKPSTFISQFYDSFKPSDSIKGVNPYVKKSKLFFNDLFSNDSVMRKKAIRGVLLVTLDSTDFTSLKKAIGSFNWNDKKYLDTKKKFISKLEEVNTHESADYLKELYYSSADTVEMQYTILEALVRHRTQYSLNLFRDIIISEPPVLAVPAGNERIAPQDRFSAYSNINFLDELYDSLKLTATILHELLPLIHLEDYKWPIMRLLCATLDSGLLDKSDYDQYFSKFLIEAKQELKKQVIGEKNRRIQKAEENKVEQPSNSFYENERDQGNE